MKERGDQPGASGVSRRQFLKGSSLAVHANLFDDRAIPSDEIQASRRMKTNPP